MIPSAPESRRRCSRRLAVHSPKTPNKLTELPRRLQHLHYHVVDGVRRAARRVVARRARRRRVGAGGERARAGAERAAHHRRLELALEARVAVLPARATRRRP